MNRDILRRKAAALDGRSWSTPVILILIIGLVTFVGTMGPASLERSTVTMLIHLTVVVGIYVFIGNSGVFSFGHIAFMAIGAYAGAILVMDVESKEMLLPEMLDPLKAVHLAPVPATIVAGLVAMTFAIAVSIPLMRLTGLTAGLATFAVLIVVYVVASNWTGVTNAVTGISGIPRTVSAWSGLLWAACVVVVAFAYQLTSSCRRLRAAREDEEGARAIGVRIARERRISFALSAFIVGVGGALFAQAQQAIQPDAFYTALTFVTIAMLVVGGINSLSGAVVGALLISIVTELLSRLENGFDIGNYIITAPRGTTQVMLAVIMLAVLIFRPSGLLGSFELYLKQPPWRRARQAE